MSKLKRLAAELRSCPVVVAVEFNSGHVAYVGFKRRAYADKYQSALKERKGIARTVQITQPKQ